MGGREGGGGEGEAVGANLEAPTECVYACARQVISA